VCRLRDSPSTLVHASFTFRCHHIPKLIHIHVQQQTDSTACNWHHLVQMATQTDRQTDRRCPCLRHASHITSAHAKAQACQEPLDSQHLFQVDFAQHQYTVCALARPWTRDSAFYFPRKVGERRKNGGERELTSALNTAVMSDSM